ncbi:Mu transposase domain-containing protein [Kitasatospora sp. SC0581]|uniref:Mu transposase domain-containing protein n=1 Tax=Kitasatospora sp. SC0581 TaxID=3394360 RepID=UPI003A88D1A1
MMIRRDAEAGMSNRALQRRHNVGYRTVKAALDHMDHEKRTPSPQGMSDPFLDDTPRRMVRGYISALEEQFTLPSETASPGTPGPLSDSAVDAEVDFIDVTVRLAGKLTTCYLFTFRLTYSGKAVHRIFASAGQEAFLEGHVHALSTIGGVPTGHVYYAPSRALLSDVLGIPRRQSEPQRWTAFRKHYDLNVVYGQPANCSIIRNGIHTPSGQFKRRHLMPAPEVETLAELNTLIDRWDREDGSLRSESGSHTVNHCFGIEKKCLGALPSEPFETARAMTPKVDRHGLITVRMNRYSVPVWLIGCTVRVQLSSSELVVYDGKDEVARHARLASRDGVRLDLNHYLKALIRNPATLPGSTALEQARSAGAFTPVHQLWWDQAVIALGEQGGTRALADVLLLSRHLSHEHVAIGLASTLKSGTISADAVALEARKAAEADGSAAGDEPPAPADPSAAKRLANLPPDNRPVPSVATYDQLLRRPRTNRPPV